MIPFHAILLSEYAECTFKQSRIGLIACSLHPIMEEILTLWGIFWIQYKISTEEEIDTTRLSLEYFLHERSMHVSVYCP